MFCVVGVACFFLVHAPGLGCVLGFALCECEWILLAAAVCGGWWVFFSGEFDPGSGRTLAACLTHASRTDRMLLLWCVVSGERVSNT